MGKITKPFFCGMSICRFPSTTLALFGLVWFKLFEFIKKWPLILKAAKKWICKRSKTILDGLLNIDDINFIRARERAQSRDASNMLN